MPQVFKPRLRRPFQDRFASQIGAFYHVSVAISVRFMALRGQNPARARRNMHHPISRKASRPPSRMPSSTSNISCHMAASWNCCGAGGAQNTCCSPDFPLSSLANHVISPFKFAICKGNPLNSIQALLASTSSVQEAKGAPRISGVILGDALRTHLRPA